LENQVSLGLKVSETNTGKKVKERVHSSWYKNDTFYSYVNSKFMLETLKKIHIAESINKLKVYPEKENRLRIFKLPLDKIKVVIIGQDPYHNDNADGFAFSCKNRLSPSLAGIFNCIWKQVYEEDRDKLIDKHIKYYPDSKFPPLHPIEVMPFDLKRWVTQGIFLLNTCLTVTKGKPYSHSEIGWQKFTKTVVKEISKTQDNVYFLLWGRKAEPYAKLIDERKHHVLVYEHPAAASYRDDEWECPHFNEVLEEYPDIIW